MSKIRPMSNGQSTLGLNYGPLPTNAKQGPFGMGTPKQGDSDVTNIINAMQDLQPGREYLIYKFISELKADLGITNMTDMFDCFYVLSAPSARDSYINWAQPGTYDLTLIGTTGSGLKSLTFTPNIGWTNNSTTNTTSVLNTNFNPYNKLVNFGNKDQIPTIGNTSSLVNTGGSFGVYVTARNRTLGGQNVYEFGAMSTLGVGTVFSCYHSTANSPRYGLMSTANTVAPTNLSLIGPATNGGFYQVYKKFNRSNELYFNGDLVVKTEVLNDTSGAAINIADVGPFLICNMNNNSSGGATVSLGSFASLRQISFVYIGSKDVKPDILYRRLKEYQINTGFNYTNVTQTI